MPKKVLMRSEYAEIRASGEDAELWIYGDIGSSWWDDESITAKSVADTLAAITGGTLTVRINSYGGVVADGIAIHNAIKRCKATIKRVEIDGVAMSSASLIAMAADPGECRIASNGLLMIHAPWGYASGNAAELREYAAMLDRYAAAMSASYARGSITAADALALLTDGADHYFTADEAIAAGYCDAISDAALIEQDASARLSADSVRAAAIDRYRCDQPTACRIVSAATRTHSAPRGAITGDTRMAGETKPDPAATDPAANPQTPAQPTAEQIEARAQEMIVAHGKRLDTELAPLMADSYPHAAMVRDHVMAARADLSQTPDRVRAAILAKLGEQTQQPLGSPSYTRATAGEDERDKRKAAAASALLIRAAVRQEKDGELQGNPFAGMRLVRIAEDCLVRAGIRIDSHDPMRIVGEAFTQTSSDFPVLLENTMHKSMQMGYALASLTWRRFCAVGSVSDFRAHNRYMLGSLSDLQDVNEAGEIKTAAIPDGRKQSVSIGTKGQIINLTRRAIIDDDLGAFVGLAQARGQAAARTIENSVFTSIGLNSGYGPLLSDGKSIIHADHGNIAATGGAPSVTTVEAGIIKMAAQTDISGNDYLDLSPTILLVPKGLEVTSRVLNASTTDPAASTGSSKNPNIPNPYAGYFSDIVASQRLAATKWYMLASPTIAPVLEVSFLNGVQEPLMEMEMGFTIDGARWRTRLDFGVSGVGYEGIVFNAGQ